MLEIVVLQFFTYKNKCRIVGSIFFMYKNRFEMIGWVCFGYKQQIVLPSKNSSQL